MAGLGMALPYALALSCLLLTDPSLRTACSGAGIGDSIYRSLSSHRLSAASRLRSICPLPSARTCPHLLLLVAYH
jgi:hypothetical protein